MKINVTLKVELSEMVVDGQFTTANHIFIGAEQKLITLLAEKCVKVFFFVLFTFCLNSPLVVQIYCLLYIIIILSETEIAHPSLT